MTNLREAAQMAYAVPLHELLATVPRDARLVIEDADGKGTRFIPVGRYCHEAAEALRAALAQPKQEPVAWMHIQGDHQDPCFRELTEDEMSRGWTQEPLYTAPPQREWVGLTDAERQECLYSDPIFGMAASTFARAIETKLKEKNI